MKRLMGVMVLAAGLVAACDKKTEAPASPPAPVASAQKPHGAEPHAHAAPHGGWVESTPRGHLELVATREGSYRVYLLDETMNVRPVEGASGSIKVAKGGYPDVALTPAGDHLAGKGPEHTDDHLAMVATVVQGGKPETARFAAHLEAEGHGSGLEGTLRQAPCPTPPPAGLTAEQCAKQGGVYTLEVKGGAPVLVVAAPGKEAQALLAPRVGQSVHVTGAVEGEGAARRVLAEAVTMEHDHTPLQGGIVAMSGDMHLEVLSLKSGEVLLWVTDAFRKPVPLMGMKGTVEAGGQSVPLTPEPGGQFLTASLPASSGERETTVRLPMPGDPEYFITFLLTPKDAAGPGVPAASPASEKSATASAAPAKAQEPPVQEVTITVTGGYQPSEVKLKKGVPARLRFIRKDTGGCAEELLIPDFGVKQPLPGLTETVVAFTPDKAGTFPFTCGMRMMKGKLVVN